MLVGLPALQKTQAGGSRGRAEGAQAQGSRGGGVGGRCDKLKITAVVEVSDFSATKGPGLCTVVIAEVRAASEERNQSRGGCCTAPGGEELCFHPREELASLGSEDGAPGNAGTLLGLGMGQWPHGLVASMLL